MNSAPLIDVSDVWLRWMVSMSWQVAVLVTALFVINWGLRQQSARLRYSLWTLVPLRLVLPPTLALATGWAWWLLPARGVEQPFAEPAVAVAPTPTADHGHVEPRAFPVAEYPLDEQQTAAPVIAKPIEKLAVAASQVESPIPWSVWLFATWVMGVTMMLVRLGQGLRQARALISSSTEILVPSLKEAHAACCERVGVSSCVELRESSAIETPLLVGIFQPRIILPLALTGQLSSAELEAVLIHELQHVRRFDAAMGVVQALLKAVYFFHPGVWLGDWMLTRLREEACDEATVGILAGQRRDYGTAILKLAEQSLRPAPPMTVGVVDSGSHITHRMRRILDPKLPWKWRMGLPAAALFLVTAAVLLPSAARTEEKQASDSAAQPAVQGPVDLKKEDAKPLAGGKQNDPGSALQQSDEMIRLIEEVRRQEDQYRQLETQIETTLYGGRGYDVHAIVAGDLFWTRTQDRLTTEHPLEVTESVFDGQRTTLIHQGQSVEFFAYRHEHVLYAPPHAWMLTEQRVNFPLSVLLGGTAALARHPKVARFPTERGSVLEFGKLETQWEGEETIDGHPCAKVSIQRWFYSTDKPSSQFLWLAKDRNYLPLKWTQTRPYSPKDPQRETVVTEFQEIAPGIYLPKLIMDRPQPGTEAQAGQTEPLVRVRLIHAQNLNKAVAPASIPKLAIPEDLPQFAISASHQLTSSPAHPHTPKPATLSLEQLLERLRSEEARYQNLQVSSKSHYRKMPGNSLGESEYFENETERQTIREGDRQWNRESNHVVVANGKRSVYSQISTTDGVWSRSLFVQTSEHGTARQAHLRHQRHAWGIVPHRLLMDNRDASDKSLSDYLTSGSRHEKFVTTIENEEIVNGEPCLKLKLLTKHGNYQRLWLAINKNLLMVRHEWWEPGWGGTLPTSISWVQEYREVTPGVWVPSQMSTLVSRKFEVFGRLANEMAINWRCDTQVIEAKLNETHPSETFRQISVPKDTEVYVTDEKGLNAGRYIQPADGNIELEWSRYLQMRSEGEKRDEVRKQRIAALDQLVGKAAPEFPVGAEWVNGTAITWKELRGKIVILDFWAEWCGPCHGEAEELAKLADAIEASGIVVIGVHPPGSERTQIEKIAKEWKFSHPTVVDLVPAKGQEGWGQFCSQCQIYQLPSMLVVDGSGNVVAHGTRMFDMLQAAHRAKSVSSTRSENAPAQPAEKAQAEPARDAVPVPPPEAPQEPKGAVTGVLVRATDSTPISGATVILHAGGSHRAISDAEGRFVIEKVPAGAWAFPVWGHLGNLVTEKVTVRQKKNADPSVVEFDPLRLEMTEGKRVEFHVTSKETGAPLAGAAVRFGYPDRRLVMTDVNGTALVEGLLAETYDVTIEADGHARNTPKLDLSQSAALTELNVGLDAGGIVRGTVVDPDGKPVSGVGVTYWSGGESGYSGDASRTDERGAFQHRFLALNTPIKVTIQKEGYLDQEKSFTLSAAEREQELQIVLPARPTGGSIAGVVTGENGKPIAGAEIYNKSNRPTRPSTKTDSQGRYVLHDLTAGFAGYDVTVAAQGFAPQLVSVTPGTAEQPGLVNVTMAPGHKIHGRIVLEGKKSSKGAMINARSPAFAHELGELKSVDDDGSFFLDSLPADARFDVQSEGYSMRINTELELDSAEPIIVTLAAPAIIRGHVVDQKTGLPIPQFRIRVSFVPTSQMRDAQCSYKLSQGVTFQSKTGEFLLTPLTNAAAYTVTIEAENYEPSVVPGLVAASADQAQDSQFKLTPIDPSQFFTLSGQFLDHEGKPKPGVEMRLIVSTDPSSGEADNRFNWVLIQSEQLGQKPYCNQYLSGITNAEGRFEFKKILPGKHMQLVYWGKGVPTGRAFVAHKSQPGASDTLVTHLPQPAKVRVTVDREGFPEAGSLRLTRPSGAFEDQEIPFRDDEYTYEFEDVPPGEYQLSVMSKPEHYVEDGHTFYQLAPLANKMLHINAGDEQEVDFIPEVNVEPGRRETEGDNKVPTTPDKSKSRIRPSR